MTAELVPTSEQTPVRFDSPVGLNLPDDLDAHQWAALGPGLLSMARSAQWWVADWILYAQARKDSDDTWGRMYADALDFTGLSYQTLRTWVVVARAIPLGRRFEELPFSHHAEVAGLDPDEQTMWLKRAAKGETDDENNHRQWTVAELRAAIRASQALDAPSRPADGPRAVRVPLRPDQWGVLARFVRNALAKLPLLVDPDDRAVLDEVLSVLDEAREKAA